MCGGCLSFAPSRDRAVSNTLLNDGRTSTQAAFRSPEGACLDGSVPDCVIERGDPRQVLVGSDLRAAPEREADACLVEVDAGPQIGLQRRFQRGPGRRLQQVEALVGGADRVGLLQHQLLAFVEPLQRTGDRECEHQTHEGEYRALDGTQSGYRRSTLANQVARTEPAPQVHQDQRADEEGDRNGGGKQQKRDFDHPGCKGGR